MYVVHWQMVPYSFDAFEQYVHSFQTPVTQITIMWKVKIVSHLEYFWSGLSKSIYEYFKKYIHFLPIWSFTFWNYISYYITYWNIFFVPDHMVYERGVEDPIACGKATQQLLTPQRFIHYQMCCPVVILRHCQYSFTEAPQRLLILILGLGT